MSARAETDGPRAQAPAAGERALIHGAVAHWARRTPHAPALITPAGITDYARLHRAATHCAAGLRAHGVGPGDLVPVLLPRTEALVPVLLGVLQCGAGYAALDPRWPAPRLSGLLEALNPPLYVARTDLAGVRRPRWSPPEDPCATAGGPGPEGLPGGVLEGLPDGIPVAVTPDAPASVFFTSGTTGTPKGVISPHRATTRLAPSASAWTGPGRVMAQTAPTPWDAYSLEVWTPLISGGASALAPGDHLMPGRLRALVRESAVDTVFLTTALFNLFMDEDPGALTGLRTLLTGGERMSVRHVRRCRAAHPELEIVNCYGPVESCVFATTQPVGPAELDLPQGVPLGTAVSGTRLHVLRGDEPAAPGETGEICVSGDGLAHGYLDDPWLTAERFPTLRIDGADTRLYRTGDRGALDHDGALHFRGREDRQVKIAGHRVEPQEIEETVRGFPGVAQCAVLTTDDGGSALRLALFYTTEPRKGGGTDTSPAALRHALAAALPAYLVPPLISRQKSFPLTPNGKTDTRALLARLTDPAPGPHPAPRPHPAPLTDPAPRPAAPAPYPGAAAPRTGPAVPAAPRSPR
ncbi:AMP-binding protein [Streptomyces sp. NPDC000594]|uniref:AMP-binding protein n=1 Tax=Streptomyces sp. NPDC000594 TaxID=3154261 RepID=UPI003321820D